MQHPQNMKKALGKTKKEYMSSSLCSCVSIRMKDQKELLFLPFSPQPLLTPLPLRALRQHLERGTAQSPLRISIRPSRSRCRRRNHTINIDKGQLRSIHLHRRPANKSMLAKQALNRRLEGWKTGSDDTEPQLELSVQGTGDGVAEGVAGAEAVEGGHLDAGDGGGDETQAHEEGDGDLLAERAAESPD